MKLFDKRPLSLILCILLGGFVVFSFDTNGYIRFLLLLLPFSLLILSHTLSIKKERRIILKFSSLALLFSMLASYIYFELWFKAYERFDESVNVEGTVIEMNPSTYNSTTYIIKTDNINNEPLTEYKISVNLSIEESDGIILGTKISFEGRLYSFVYGGDINNTSYNFSRGISARAEDITNISIIEQTGTPLSEKIAYIREYISRYAIMLSNKETGTLLCALLFGERDSLADDVRLDFKRIGISHILALSGMHLTILSLGLNKLLSLLRIGKKKRTATVIAFTLLYMAFTGFSVSVVRAGIMLILASLLYLLSQSHDSATSLSIAVTVIVGITPYAIYDIALWLSALATLGVIMAGEYYSKRPPSKNTVERCARFVAGSFMTTLFAVATTIVITATSFKGFSLAAPLTTFIFSILVEIIMYIGSFMLIFGTFLPIKYLLIPISSFTLDLADLMSADRYVYISTSYIPITVALIIFSLTLYLFTVLSIKKKKLVIGIIITSFLAIYAVSGFIYYNQAKTDDIIYASDSKYDAFILKSGGETALIESSQYSKSLAYNSLDFLEKENITYVDVYYLTHYAWGLEDTFTTLLSNIVIEEIYLPTPANDDENTILSKLEAELRDYDVTLTFYDNDDKVHFGNFEIKSIYSVAYGEGASTNAFKIESGSITYTYLSAGMMASKYDGITYAEIADAEVLIFGSHGKKYADAYYFEAQSPGKYSIILSSDNCFMTQSSLIFYEKSGCKVYSHPQHMSIYQKSDVE